MNELIKIPFGNALRVGLDLPEGLTEAEWKQVGHNLLRCKDSLQFWIGDWVNYGQGYFKNYDDVMKVFGVEGEGNYGYEKTTLENFASVAKRVPISLRREKLSFGHHAIVAALDPEKQGFYLALAVINGFTVAELTREIRGRLKDKATTGTNSTHDTFIFESWINEATRGLKNFPVSQWEDDDLSKRLDSLIAIENKLFTEALRRNLPIPTNIDRVKALEVV